MVLLVQRESRMALKVQCRVRDMETFFLLFVGTHKAEFHPIKRLQLVGRSQGTDF